MARYMIVSRKKGNRRAYLDGYIINDLKSAKEQAEKILLTCEYTMIKIVDADTYQPVKTYTKSKQ